jgi:small subunit ribosomal protein S4
MVVHGHVTVNGQRVDRPSYQVKAGQVISVTEKSRTKPFIQEAVESSATRPRPAYLDFDPAKVTGTLVSEPQAEDLPLPVNLQAIVEFYSQKL